MNKLLPFLAFSILLLVPVGAQNAFAHGNIDQENPPPNDSLFCGIWDPLLAPNFHAAQEFTPTDNNLVAIEVELQQLQLVGIEPITVNIWSPNVGGNLEGSALINSADLPGVGNLDIVHVDFAAQIPLVPGNPYFLELQVNGPDAGLGDILWSLKDSDTYPGGTSICGQNPTPDNDFIFRTLSDSSQGIGGKIIPVESSSLLLAGAQSFSWMIPVLLSGIGIGLFVVSRKSE